MCDTMNRIVNKHLDTKGLLCPEPVMLLHRAVRELSSGEVIEVVCTDSSTQRDIPKFCLFLGHELLEQREEEGSYYYWIQKSD